MAETAEATENKTDENQQEQKTQAQSTEFTEVAETGANGAEGGIDILLDVNISISVSLGQTEIPVRQLLKLGPGSVLKLDKQVDAPADLYLKDVKFATGNIVVVDDQFGVRINQILGVDAAANL